jgi:hypothetical protein
MFTRFKGEKKEKSSSFFVFFAFAWFFTLIGTFEQTKKKKPRTPRKRFLVLSPFTRRILLKDLLRYLSSI